MFLFKKKKETTEVNVEAEKAEVKKAAAPPVKVVDKSAKPSKNDKPVKGAPVRVVVPGNDKVGQSPNPDEMADSLLVKVDPNPAIENIDEALVAAVLKPELAPAVVQTAPVSPVVQVVADPVPAVTDKAAAPASPPAVEAPKAEQSAAKPAEAGVKKPAEGEKKAAEGEAKGNMFSNLFGKADVEEETYLDRLIKSLPDISIEEVINEADEVKSLMNEWSQSSKR